MRERIFLSTSAGHDHARLNVYRALFFGLGIVQYHLLQWDRRGLALFRLILHFLKIRPFGRMLRARLPTRLYLCYVLGFF